MGIYGGFMGSDPMGFLGGDLPTGKHTTTKNNDAQLSCDEWPDSADQSESSQG